MLPTNKEILRVSIANPEPIYDHYYQKEYFIISEDATKPNALMKANRSLLDLVTAYRVNAEMGNDRANEPLIAEMMRLLETKNINTSEFTSFWECCDVSYSVFRHLSQEEKKQFLHRITAEYISRRHAVYSAHGYTATTLQVKADSFAHKRSGEQGMQKVVRILTELRIPLVEDDGHSAVEAPDQRWLILPDKGHGSAFRSLLKRRGLSFEWSRDHKGKFPDYAVNLGEHLFVIEHKHMKELGGGQDKQIVEISEFISQTEEDANTHYVAFLDGILFNKVFAPSATGKVAIQRDEIARALESHPSNYFVNTHGFLALMKAFAEAAE